MTRRIAFQMDPPEGLNIEKDSTLRLMKEALRRGYKVWYYTPEALFVREGWVGALAREALRENGQGLFESGPPGEVNLATMDMVHLRQDPPFDMGYITTTYMLEQLPPSVWVMNNPREVRNHPEKWMPSLFPDFVPPTLMASRLELMEDFLKQHGTIIVKPLYAHGGAGVLKVTNRKELKTAFESVAKTYGLPAIAQRYVPEVEQGDKRIFLVNGEYFGGLLRIPAEGSVLANTAAGGSAVPLDLPPRSRAICEALGPVLREKGLFFAGIDVIGDYLTEINITSPTGFYWLEVLYGRNPTAEFWDKIEQSWAGKPQISLAKNR